MELPTIRHITLPERERGTQYAPGFSGCPLKDHRADMDIDEEEDTAAPGFRASHHRSRGEEGTA